MTKYAETSGTNGTALFSLIIASSQDSKGIHTAGRRGGGYRGYGLTDNDSKKECAAGFTDVELRTQASGSVRGQSSKRT
jgi:hypothetical protein